MGPIQSSFNQLTFSALGAVGGLIKGFGGSFSPKSKKKEVKAPKDVSTLLATQKADYTARIGKRPYAKYKAYEAVISANDSIAQKALTREAVKMRFSEVMKGGE